MRVGDYIIYPAFFILIGLIIAFFVAIFLIIKFLRKAKHTKLMQFLNKITEWQKEQIPNYIDSAIASGIDKHTTEILNKGKKYIINNKYWNTDELKDEDSDLILTITSLLLDYIEIELYDNNDKNRAVLLLNTIDLINGGLRIEEGEYEWIGDEISSYQVGNEPIERSRMRTILISAIEEIAEYIDPDIDIISNLLNIPEIFKGIEGKILEDSIGEISNIKNIYQLDEDYIDIIYSSLIYSISSSIKSNATNILREYDLYNVRSLASLIDSLDYDKIIETLK